MELTITGKPIKKISKKLIRRAAHYYAEKLMSSRLLESLYVEIKFKDLPETEEGWENLGFCTPYYVEPIRPKLFDIDIQKDLTEQETLSVLAHEFAHVKQFATDECFEYAHQQQPGIQRRYRWRKKLVIVDETDEESDWFNPWEIDAYGYQHGLFHSFLSILDAEKAIERKRHKSY